MAAQTVSMKLGLGQPLDLDLTLQSGQAFRWRRVQTGGREWWHGFVGGEPVLLHQGRGQRDSVDYLCRDSATNIVEQRLRAYLRLDDDLPTLYTRMGEDPHLARATKTLHGMRLLRQDPWECLVGFICSGQNNILRIMGMMERMANTYGEPTALYGIERNAFPSPARLAKADEQALRALGLGFRGGPVAQAAQRVAGKKLQLERLRKQPYVRAKDQLIELNGVGEKIADCVLLFSLEKGEAFPVDRWVRRAMEDWYGVQPQMGKHGKPLKEASYGHLRDYAQGRWGNMAGYVNQYLFLGRRAEEREVGKMTHTKLPKQQARAVAT
ncbi:MAG: hypothetical protein EXR67_05720 [Dehalococcoidia bacterium]|nr:hypothetical protein [Dehalococcoidia bacterium]